MNPTTTSHRTARPSTTADRRETIALGQMSTWINQDMVWHKNDQPATAGTADETRGARTQRFPDVIS